MLPMQKPDSLTDSMTATLANEIAAEIYDAEQLMERFHLSEDEFRTILSNKSFQYMVKEARVRWNSTQNASERIKAKAEVAMEDSILTVAGMVHDVDLPANSRLEASKQLATLSGANKKAETQVSAGGGFSITINLGDPEKDIKLVGEQAAPVVIEQEQQK